MSTPRNYRSFAEFQREEIARDHKLGWSIDDLMHDAELRIADGLEGDRDPDELDFGG